jgi:hypothetical protein
MGMDTLGLLLRVWLWISVPIAIIILMVATWMNYLRDMGPKRDLKLAVGGLDGEVSPGGEMYVKRDELVGEGEALLEGGGENIRGDEPGEGAGSETVGGDWNGDASGEEELTATGKETIYQGILWMKEKYERYREQADRRYEQLREELGRSERRYQDLLATIEQKTIEQNKNSVAETVTDKRLEELESQLRSERMKVEELVAILQTNTRMLQKVIPELGK